MGLRVLVIEDTPLNLELISEVLTFAGHSVTPATTARDGIARARDLNPDVVLMDIRLPDFDGYAATRLLRAFPRIGRLPIIALTAQAMRGDAEAALAAGCDAWISKPIDVRTIAADIERIVADVRRKGDPAAAGDGATPPQR